MTAGVSLIIPCCDQARFVGAAIRAALDQTRPPAEVIVVDDGSTDDLAAALAPFEGAVRLHRQPNRGPAAARNAGIALARFALLAFLDADDLWPPASLEARLSVMARTDAGLVFGSVVNLDVRHGREDAPKPARMAGAMLARRSVFARVGPFDEGLGSAELLEWIDRARAAGCAVAFADETVLVRRIHGANMMLTAADTEAERMSVLRRIVAAKRAARQAF